MTLIRAVPAYVWAFVALVLGITSGGLFPGTLEPVANGSRALIELISMLVPLLIFAALSPAIATLIRRGLAGKFAGSVILWYVLSSSLAGLFGILVASVIFSIPFSTEGQGTFAQACTMIGELGAGGGVSYPLLAIGGAIVVAAGAVWLDPLYAGLRRVELAIARIGSSIGYFMVPLILAFGIMIGVTFGARLGMSHYGTMIVYTFFLSLAWWALYVFLLLRYLAGVRSVGPLLKRYYFPTALFAAGTCSSLATLPVNLSNAKQYGVRDEVADFVLPFGAVVNMDASALQHMAYAPFITAFLFGLDMSWSMMLVAWPFIVLYTFASPGLPAGMGTALWAAVLFATLLGLEDPMRATFVGTWVALAGGLPDMFRTATNATSDGFVSVIFDRNFDRFFGQVPEATVEAVDSAAGTAIR